VIKVEHFKKLADVIDNKTGRKWTDLIILFV
jgi:hypothetical protein